MTVIGLRDTKMREVKRLRIFGWAVHLSDGIVNALK